MNLVLWILQVVLGLYEEGGGDDIVVGEDLPGGIAAISSASGSGTTEGK